VLGQTSRALSPLLDQFLHWFRVTMRRNIARRAALVEIAVLGDHTPSRSRNRPGELSQLCLDIARKRCLAVRRTITRLLNRAELCEARQEHRHRIDAAFAHGPGPFCPTRPQSRGPQAKRNDHDKRTRRHSPAHHRQDRQRHRARRRRTSFHRVGDSSMVKQRTLTPLILVRIQLLRTPPGSRDRDSRLRRRPSAPCGDKERAADRPCRPRVDRTPCRARGGQASDIGHLPHSHERGAS
jgi:hypothetical protein